MEKRKAHYRLEEIKAAFADPDKINRTNTAREGAAGLALDDPGVVEVIQSLTNRDLQKSMTSKWNNAVWQDVYRPMRGPDRLYVKFTLDAQGQYLLISFKSGDE